MKTLLLRGLSSRKMTARVPLFGERGCLRNPGVNSSKSSMELEGTCLSRVMSFKGKVERPQGSAFWLGGGGGQEISFSEGKPYSLFFYSSKKGCRPLTDQNRLSTSGAERRGTCRIFLGGDSRLSPGEGSSSLSGVLKCHCSLRNRPSTSMVKSFRRQSLIRIVCSFPGGGEARRKRELPPSRPRSGNEDLAWLNPFSSLARKGKG